MKKTYHTPTVEPLSLTEEDFIALSIATEGEADPNKSVLTNAHIGEDFCESDWEDEK